MHQYVQHDVLGHAPGEIRIVDADDRNTFRKGRVLQNRVDTGAKRHDDLEIGQALHHAGRRQPGSTIFDVGDISHLVRPDAHIKIRRHFAHRRSPDIDGPGRKNKQKCHY